MRAKNRDKKYKTYSKKSKKILAKDLIKIDEVNNEDEVKEFPGPKKSIKDFKNLYKSYKRDIGVSNFTLKRAIKKVGEWVLTNEIHRNIKMKDNFDKEIEYKMEKKKEIQNKIVNIANDNESRKVIEYFSKQIQNQKELYKGFCEIKKRIDSKLGSIKDIIPQLEKKLSQKKNLLIKLSTDNINLIQQIDNLEHSLPKIIKDKIIQKSTHTENSETKLNDDINSDEKNDNNKIELSDERIEKEKEIIKKKRHKIEQLEEILKEQKTKNDLLIKNINQMYHNIFKCKNVYNEGMHEIAKELLKVNEIEIDKVINNKNNNCNSLYFDIIKNNFNQGIQKNELLKTPIRNDKIEKQFRYPLSEKANLTDQYYNSVKNIIEESNKISKISNFKNNKFSWDDFKQLSGYQIYTLLNINKENLDKLFRLVFPKNFSL